MKSLLPVRGTVHHYTAVDGIETGMHEDAIRFTLHEGAIQIDVAAVIPPLQKLDNQRFMEALYEHVGPKKDNRLAEFFHPTEKREAGFQKDQGRKALVCSYLIDQSGKLTQESFSVTMVIAETVSYEDFGKHPYIRRYLDAAKTVLNGQRHERIRKFADNAGSAEKKAASDGLAGTLVHQLLMLFNDSCRTKAYRMGTPYIRRDKATAEHIAGYKISHGLARFNCGLRDPCALVNAVNLSSRLTGGLPYYPEKTLRKMLPQVNN